MEKFIILLKYAHSNDWFIGSDYDADGKDLGTCFYDTEGLAEKSAKEIVGFDTESNGMPQRGVNYQIVPVTVTQKS